MTRHIISLSNQKGGVGKTTSTRLLGINLAESGRRVLMIDADPQANLTRSVTDEEVPGLYEALTGIDYDIQEITQGLYLLGGSNKLSGLEKSLIGELDCYVRLRELLEEDIFSDFNYILIDTPPSLGVLTINALTASAYVIAPMNPAIYSLQGTNDLMDSIVKVRKNLNSKLTLLGVIINAFDAHPVITRQIRDEIVEAFGKLVFSTPLSRSVKVEEALAGRRGLVSGESKVGDEMRHISDEVIVRVEGVQ